MADFGFFVAAESFKLVESLDSTAEIKKTWSIERCQVSWQEGVHPECSPWKEIVGSGPCRVERNASADGLTYVWVDRKLL